MIKLLKQYQIQTTPFGATKDWNLNNTDNENLILFESTGSDDGLPFALEFLDYGDGSEYPVENYSCDIALEQQPNDLATSRTGLNVNGIVNTDTEPLNEDGTYKRSIYHQVKTVFYNNYLDPSKIWGIENIDFTLSQTRRSLSDQFRLIDIPRNVYGDKIVPNTVKIYDNTLDNIYIIQDDGNGNLFAGKNLFSHQQELGEYTNKFLPLESSPYCNYYWDIVPTNPPTYVSDSILYSTIEFSNGFTETQPPYIDSNTLTARFDSGMLLDTVIIVTSSFDSTPLTAEFLSGSIRDVVITTTSSFDSTPLTAEFLSGSIRDTVITVTSSFDSTSLTAEFLSGSNITTTFPATMSFDITSFTVGFSGGSLT